MPTGTTFCQVCQQQRLTTQGSTNNTFHLLMTLLTGGLWLIVWLVRGLGKEATTWRCAICGTPVGGGTTAPAQATYFWPSWTKWGKEEAARKGR